MTKVAVTGGAGFLGSHIVKSLLEKGYEVTIIDDLSSGSIKNLRDLGVQQDCTIGDLRNYDFTRKALREMNTVFHFAAEVGSVAYLHGSNECELAALQSNLVIDTNVLRASVENRVNSMIYASSVSVYPIDEQLGSHVEFKEEDLERKINPEGGYGWSKYMGEKQLSLMSDISFGIARIFHAYGPNIYLNEDRSQVIGSFIRKVVRYPNEDFVIWGDGKQRRCFVYIDDVIDALLRLYDYVEKHGNLTVNIGSRDEVSVLELARRIINYSKKDIPVKFDLSRPTGALSRTPNLERIGIILDWKPIVDLSAGLGKTYDWASKRLSEAPTSYEHDVSEYRQACTNKPEDDWRI